MLGCESALNARWVANLGCEFNAPASPSQTTSSRMRLTSYCFFALLAFCGDIARAQDSPAPAMRGSIVEDRAAKKLLEAGDARLDADESSKAIEVWKSVIERYPRSRFRFDAHLRLGDFFLDKEKAYDRARGHFEAAAVEENSAESQRAEATLKLGICYYHLRNFGKSFQVMREVIEKYPVSPEVNEAYYYIGLGHFQLGHYSRAIQALEKVGTTLSADAGQGERLEAGKRLFVRIEDADLAVLDANEAVTVTCKTTSGDEESIACYPVGQNVRLVFGSLPSRLGKAVANNNTLELRGGDQIEVTYVDAHTADRQQQRKVLKTVAVVGTALAAITDGANAEVISGVVLDKAVNLRVVDADGDTSDAADKLTAEAHVYRLKTDEELEAEAIRAAGALSSDESVPEAEDPIAAPEPLEIERWKRIDTVKVGLTEAKVKDFMATTSNDSALTTTPVVEVQADDNLIRTGVFHATVSLSKSEGVIEGDDVLQALPNDEVRLVYLDEKHLREGTRQVQAAARCLEGNIGGVRVTKAEISDVELKIQTQLRTADALTQIGNRYKEFGLAEKAQEKYSQALITCEEVSDDARKLRGSSLEQLYVQLWNIYFAMDKLELAAAMCERLQNEFPQSGFVDDALLQLAEVARKQGNLERAVSIFTRLVAMQTSQLRGDAQFGLAECYEAMANNAPANAAPQLHDRAFQEFKRVYDQFPDSGRVGEAVAKMANYYYLQKDYARAIDTFEAVLSNQPDAKFLDVILFNYGRCLFRMERKAEARQRFEQLLSEFPESPLAVDAKAISAALSAESP
jgi:TolA-binding protein